GIIGEHISTDCTLPQRAVANNPNIVYVLMEDLTIESSATLTINPGVVIKSYRSIFVDGGLNAEGTAHSMIVFTSTKDDAHGGDTNNDGSASSPDAEDWERVQFNGGSSGTFDYCVIAYGGSEYYQRGAIELVNASPTISNCTISSNAFGIKCGGGSNPTILDSAFSDNARTPILISLLANPSFSGNTFSDNGYKALGIVGETINSSCALGRRTVAGIENITYVLMEDLTIGSWATLTIEPGVVIKLRGGSRIIFVNGGLNAEGTADSMIVFTSTKDDAHGGDTNNDSSATSPDDEDWERIHFNAGSAGVFDYCVIAYGGSEYYQRGAIELVNASPTISNCEIVNNSNGIVCYGTSNPPIHYNDICGNTEYGIYNMDSVVTIDAINNWWGDNSGPCNTSSGPPDYNPDGLGDRVNDYVTYRPWTGMPVEHITFERWYGGGEDDCGNSVQQTKDGGYIVAGYTNSYGAGDRDFYLIKTNSYGDTLWTKTYGGGNSDYGSSVQQTSDGGYIIGGSTYSYGPNTPSYANFYLVKANSSGYTLWTRNYNGGSNNDRCYSVQQTNDGSYILAGYSWGYLYGYDDVFLVKTDSIGNALWKKAYGGSINDEGNSVKQTTDGGYIITGRRDCPIWTSGGDVYLIKTDSLGNSLWTKTYGGDFMDYGNSVQQTSDGGFIIAG
ncbi:MAG: right-handed parallel beta-helix repeat-containing protein, partial [Spirochaetales bacterium]|nr:right-handed parallel beta-helix repeat-containing protein [Spirochaetales bacterium]